MTRHVAILLALAGCTAADPSDSDDDPACTGKCDGGGSPRAARADLLANLHAQMDAPAFLFGHQRFNITGVGADGTQWLATEGSLDRSDVKSLVGEHPVVMGFDAWDLAIKPQTWSPTGKVHAEAAKHVHAIGGVVALDFHQHGCTAEGFGGAGNEACLCRVANDDGYARSWLLDGDYQKVADAIERYGLDRIPIVFRPLHEQNGDWFWWGKAYWDCARYVAQPRFTGPAAYQRVFRTIVTYLRVERGLDNLLVAYAPNGGASVTAEAGYLLGYPGDEYVDILGLDYYYQRTPSFATQTAELRTTLALMTQLARTRGKVAALTEVGNTQLASETASTTRHWFTTELLPAVDAAGVDLAYVSIWENRTRGEKQFWVPYAGHPAVDDFLAFAASDATALITDAPAFDAPPADGYPVCASCAADPDGDRWGWERGESCRVASWCVVPEYPICARCDSDPDGDGWGWEGERSCEVLATCR